MKGRLPVKVRLTRLLRIVLPAAVVLVCGVLGVFGVLVYKITHPDTIAESAKPLHYLLPSLEVDIPSGESGGILGWWIPGLKGGPGIVLAPGYGMSRSDALSLATALHEDGFNLLIYDQGGSGSSHRSTNSLGLCESEDMLAALRFMEGQPDTDGSRLGIWGVDVNARAALQAAASVPEVRAIAADGAFESVSDFLDLKVDEQFGTGSSFLRFGCRQIFRLVQITFACSSKSELRLPALFDRSILFIQGENRKELGRLTSALYEKVPSQKEMVSLKSVRVHAMSGEDLMSYDRQVADFFHLNLP